MRSLGRRWDRCRRPGGEATRDGHLYLMRGCDAVRRRAGHRRCDGNFGKSQAARRSAHEGTFSPIPFMNQVLAVCGCNFCGSDVVSGVQGFKMGPKLGHGKICRGARRRWATTANHVRRRAQRERRYLAVGARSRPRRRGTGPQNDRDV